MERRPVPAAGVVCLRGGEVLLIRRGRPPRHGEWSLPGGRMEWGETAAACALRELREEAGVEAELLGLLDVVDGWFPAAGGEQERHYLLVDYAARWRSGEPVPGDDASEARFFPIDQALAMIDWNETRRIIAVAVERFGLGRENWIERGDVIAQLCTIQSNGTVLVGGRFLCASDEDEDRMANQLQSRGLSLFDIDQCEMVGAKLVSANPKDIRQTIAEFRLMAIEIGARLQSVETGDFEGEPDILAGEIGRRR